MVDETRPEQRIDGDGLERALRQPDGSGGGYPGRLCPRPTGPFALVLFRDCLGSTNEREGRRIQNHE